MKIICISASNMQHSGIDSVSMTICRKIGDMLRAEGVSSEIIDLRRYSLSPCTGCGGCFETKRCGHDADFNKIYERLVDADGVFSCRHITRLSRRNSACCWKRWRR